MVIKPCGKNWRRWVLETLS